MRKQKNETIVLKKGKKDIQLDYAELRKAVLVLRAVNHKLRQRVIDLLEENEAMTVTDMADYADLAQAKNNNSSTIKIPVSTEWANVYMSRVLPDRASIDAGSTTPNSGINMT